MTPPTTPAFTHDVFLSHSSKDEAVVLRTLLETFISRTWCLRQPCDGSALLTLPSGHGIDGEIEFKDDQGRASGKRLFVQLNPATPT